MLSTSIFHTEGTAKAMVKECAWCSQEKARSIILKHRNVKTTKGFIVYKYNWKIMFRDKAKSKLNVSQQAQN